MSQKDDLAFPFESQLGYSLGLTKREFFAMNAPSCPEWFDEEFTEKNMNNSDLVDVSEYLDEFDINGVSIKYTNKGKMALIKAWRYAYADLMLED